MKKLKISNETLRSLELVKGDMQILSAKMQSFLAGGTETTGIWGAPGKPGPTLPNPKPGTAG